MLLPWCVMDVASEGDCVKNEDGAVPVEVGEVGDAVVDGGDGTMVMVLWCNAAKQDLPWARTTSRTRTMMLTPMPREDLRHGPEDTGAYSSSPPTNEDEPNGSPGWNLKTSFLDPNTVDPEPEGVCFLSEPEDHRCKFAIDN
jgi:hypothetical protein